MKTKLTLKEKMAKHNEAQLRSIVHHLNLKVWYRMGTPNEPTRKTKKLLEVLTTAQAILIEKTTEVQSLPVAGQGHPER